MPSAPPAPPVGRSCRAAVEFREIEGAFPSRRNLVRVRPAHPASAGSAVCGGIHAKVTKVYRASVSTVPNPHRSPRPILHTKGLSPPHRFFSYAHAATSYRNLTSSISLGRGLAAATCRSPSSLLMFASEATAPRLEREAEIPLRRIGCSSLRTLPRSLLRPVRLSLAALPMQDPGYQHSAILHSIVNDVLVYREFSYAPCHHPARSSHRWISGVNRTIPAATMPLCSAT